MTTKTQASRMGAQTHTTSSVLSSELVAQLVRASVESGDYSHALSAVLGSDCTVADDVNITVSDSGHDDSFALTFFAVLDGREISKTFKVTAQLW